MTVKRGEDLTPSRLLRLACPIAAAACLTIGMASASPGGFATLVFVTGVALLSALAMILTRRWASVWLATIALVAFTGLAAYGLLAQADSVLMLAGAAAALAGWDLALEETRHPRDADSGAKLTGEIEKNHLRSLALAVSIGLMGAVVGQNLQVRLPFIVVALLVGLGVWMLERVLWEVNR
ncbi:MAG: hypothetical protein JW987_05150 [Anaerolineaceae bacterium]|nr:hypothetical protein [Anaerolineaceae bacterium]